MLSGIFYPIGLKRKILTTIFTVMYIKYWFNTNNLLHHILKADHAVKQ